MSVSVEIKKTSRGRKSALPMIDLSKQITLKQHHFNYSDEFVEKLANFAILHLDVRNKEFKTAWNLWKNENAEIVEIEVKKMKDAGYQGSVEEKMYFSARYYYRKRAIRENKNTDESNKDGKGERKKYESADKNTLIQMNDHIISQIESSAQTSTNGSTVSNMTPSKAFADYCEKFSVCEDDANTKKKYKNLYWRISKKIASNCSQER